MRLSRIDGILAAGAIALLTMPLVGLFVLKPRPHVYAIVPSSVMIGKVGQPLKVPLRLPTGQAQVYELACPIPYVPLTYAVSIDTITTNLRAYGCINELNGQVIWQPDTVITNTLTVNTVINGPGAQALVTPLIVNTGAGTGEIAQILGNLQVSSYNASGVKPAASSVFTGTPGVTTVEYAVYEQSGTSTFNGDFGRSAPVTTFVSNASATLNASNFVTVTLTCATKFDILRVNRIIGGTTQGFLGGSTIGNETHAFSCANGSPGPLVDTGLTADGSAFFSGDTSGLFEGAGLISRNNPRVGFFTPDAGVAANTAGIGTFNPDSNNPFSELLGCASTACVITTGLSVQGPLSANSFNIGGTGPFGAGLITMSGGTGSHNFTTAYTSAPVCVATDTTAANAVKVTSTVSAVTVTGTSTDVIAWHCSGAAN